MRSHSCEQPNANRTTCGTFSVHFINSGDTARDIELMMCDEQRFITGVRRWATRYCPLFDSLL